MSALMDYVGGGRARAWILDHFSNINHQHIPDLVALGIALATATLFAFGLEVSFISFTTQQMEKHKFLSVGIEI